MLVILATWEANIRRMAVEGQPRQIVHETPISKITTVKWSRGVAHAGPLLCKAKPCIQTPAPPKKENPEVQRKLSIALGFGHCFGGAYCTL
jgi:hypothetical protein